MDSHCCVNPAHLRAAALLFLEATICNNVAFCAFPRRAGSGLEALLKRRIFLGVLLAVAVPTSANAHDHRPKHGGLMKEGAGRVYELVVTPATITVWVTDEGNRPVVTAGTIATLTLIESGSRVEIPLAPAGENRLAATGTFAVQKGMTALLKVTVNGKEAAPLRYTLK
jgi:hypothetical protein